MHPVVHFEFHAVDPAKSLHFFEKIFGWKLSKFDGPVEYWLAQTTEPGKPGINGGIMPSKDGQPRTINTIQVPDVDEYVAKAVAAGGQICLPKMAIPGVGWLAYCSDPGGLIFGLHTPDPAAK